MSEKRRLGLVMKAIDIIRYMDNPSLARDAREDLAQDIDEIGLCPSLADGNLDELESIVEERIKESKTDTPQ